LKLAYITVMAPTGEGEKFIIDEINGLTKIGYEVTAFPVRPHNNVLHNEGKNVKSVNYPLFSCRFLGPTIITAFCHPGKFFKVLSLVIKNSNTKSNLIKNLIVFPKAIYLSKIFSRLGIQHIHAHWETTTSTIGFITHYLTNIPWSFSCHSGQILWNNMMKIKLDSCSFCRVIAEGRVKDVMNVCRTRSKSKIHVIHMGVTIPAEKNSYRNINLTNAKIICVANLDKIKGHKYLVSAMEIVHKKYRNITLTIVGDGAERDNIKKKISDLKANPYIKMTGFMDNSDIMRLYAKGEYQIFILPSISIPEEKREEGIPVSIMEAMSYGIPVISTNTGSINEVVDNNQNGFLVKDKSAQDIADRIINLIENKELWEQFSINAIEKIKNDYSVEAISKKLSTLFELDCLNYMRD
jgi:colanic acid/amylovoran biosynthesis glycosyltransferase